jgi:hypothetical protein
MKKDYKAAFSSCVNLSSLIVLQITDIIACLLKHESKSICEKYGPSMGLYGKGINRSFRMVLKISRK